MILKKHQKQKNGEKNLTEINRYSDSKRKISLCPLSRLSYYPFFPTASSTDNKQVNPTLAAYWLEASNLQMPESSF